MQLSVIFEYISLFFFNRTLAMECSTRESLWYDPVQCLQDKRSEYDNMKQLEVCCHVVQFD